MLIHCSVNNIFAFSTDSRNEFFYLIDIEYYVYHTSNKQYVNLLDVPTNPSQLNYTRDKYSPFPQVEE